MPRIAVATRSAQEASNLGFGAELPVAPPPGDEADDEDEILDVEAPVSHVIAFPTTDGARDHADPRPPVARARPVPGCSRRVGPTADHSNARACRSTRTPRADPPSTCDGRPDRQSWAPPVRSRCEVCYSLSSTRVPFLSRPQRSPRWGRFVCGQSQVVRAQPQVQISVRAGPRATNASQTCSCRNGTPNSFDLWHSQE